MLNQVVLVGTLKSVTEIMSKESLLLLSLEVSDPSSDCLSYTIPVVISSEKFPKQLFEGRARVHLGVKGYLFVKNNVLHVRGEKITILGERGAKS